MGFTAAERGFCPGPHFHRVRFSARSPRGSPGRQGMETRPFAQPAASASSTGLLSFPGGSCMQWPPHYRQHLGPARCCPALFSDVTPSSHQNTWRQQSDRVGRPWTHYPMKLGMVTHSLKDPPTRHVLRASTPEIKADLTCGQLVGKAGVEISLKAKPNKSLGVCGSQSGRSPGGDESVTGVSGRQGPRS